VYYSEAEGEGRYQIVDWKTGKAPTSAADLEEKQFQLALYRLAYSRWAGIELSRIDAVFYFVSDDRVIGPERLFSEPELVERWRAAVGERTDPGAAPVSDQSDCWAARGGRRPSRG
jgi:DNA helicase-2/ATP-dependent DNA helicase PcrA